MQLRQSRDILSLNLTRTITKELEAVEPMEGVEIQIDWINREIERTSKAQDHHRLAQNTNQVRGPIEGV